MHRAVNTYSVLMFLFLIAAILNISDKVIQQLFIIKKD